jgi:hypothetical protein
MSIERPKAIEAIINKSNVSIEHKSDVSVSFHVQEKIRSLYSAIGAFHFSFR